MATDLQTFKLINNLKPDAQYKFYWSKDEEVDKWSDTGFVFYKRQFVVETEATGFKSYLIDMWRLKPKSSTTIASVTTIPNGDRLIHADAFESAPGEVWFWLNTWYFYKFDNARNVEIDISYLGLPQKSVTARINDDDALTFIRLLIVEPRLGPPETTGPEKFHCVIIDKQSSRYNLTLEMSGETFNFRPT